MVMPYDAPWHIARNQMNDKISKLLKAMIDIAYLTTGEWETVYVAEQYYKLDWFYLRHPRMLERIEAYQDSRINQIELRNVLL